MNTNPTNLKNSSKASKGEKTMLTGLLFSAPGPVITGITAVTSHSVTQTADFVRRTAELAAIIISMIIFRKLKRTGDTDLTERSRLERLSDICIAATMCCSGVVMMILGISQIFSYTPAGKVIVGLVTAALGLLANSIFCIRYTLILREQFNPVIDGQRKLYAAKVCVDLCVVIALTAVAVFPEHPAVKYVDIIGSLIVSVYLLLKGFEIFRKLPENN